MKNCKILILCLAAIMLIGVFSSCATTTEEITVRLTIDAGEEIVFDQEMKLNYKDPTVMMLVNEAAAIYELDITYTENNDSVLDIEDYKDKTEDGVTYFWEYLINGVLPENATGGKANAQPIKDGDQIKYVYSNIPAAMEAE